MSDIIPEGILYGNLGVGSGTTNYNDLDNKPQINSVTLQGNKTASELGLVGTSDIPVTSVNGETGAVVLDGTEIEFSEGVSLNEKIIAVEQEIPVIAYPVTSVNGETGAVVLDGTEINYQAGKTINQKIDEVEAEIPVVSYPVTSVNSKTGAVVLDGTDIEYSSGVTVNSQIDTLMNYIPVYGNTASGAIATFDTSLALPLQDCTIEINAVQESGTPTPSSPKLISGFTGANIAVRGKNLIDVTKYTTGILSNGSITSTTSSTISDKQSGSVTFTTTASWAGITISDYMLVDDSKVTISYAYSGSSTVWLIVEYYDESKTYLSRSAVQATASGTTFIIPSGCVYVRMSFQMSTVTTATISNIQMEQGSTATTYEAYNGTTYPISWNDEAGTVYGGYFRIVNGFVKLVATHGVIDLSTITQGGSAGSAWVWYISLTNAKTVENSKIAPINAEKYQSIRYNAIASSTNYIALRDNGVLYVNTGSTEITPSGLCIFELATPVEYTLTSIPPIYTLQGTNNVFTDTNGNTSVVFACSLKDYIEGQ